MLSLFPGILFLAPVGVFLIRIALAVTLAYSAWNHFSKDAAGSQRLFALLEIAVAIALGVGVWTQAAALGAALVIAATLAFPHFRNVALGTTLLSLVMSLSLIVMGAGIFAFDLPL